MGAADDPANAGMDYSGLVPHGNGVADLGRVRSCTRRPSKPFFGMKMPRTLSI